MARPLPSLPMQKLPLIFSNSLPSLFILLAIFSVFSMVTFLCGSHIILKKPNSRKEERTVRLGDNKKPISRLQSNISSKALLMIKMISWRKVQDDEEGELDEGGFDGDEEVWRRTIMMGEKCRPLDFSGKILYDSNGNLLPDSPNDHQSRSKSNKKMVSLENS